MSSDSESSDYETVEISFAVALSAVRVASWWLLWAGAVLYGLHKRSTNLKGQQQGWKLYKVIVAAITLACLRFTVYMHYADEYNRGHEDYAAKVFSAYIFFANFSSSFFLALLLLLASGYCITRHQLGIHTKRVLAIPVVVWITGTVTDYIYYNVVATASDSQQIVEMSQLEGMVWFVCSVTNLSALIMAWVQIFDIMQLELQELEQQHQRTVESKRAREAAERGEAPGPAPAAPSISSSSQHKALLQHNNSHTPEPDTDLDIEAEMETFADRVGFERKRKLMRLFSGGVFAYLSATVAVMLLPVFINTSVQNTIVTGQFLVHLAFMAALAWIFRPRSHNPYLMLGDDPDDTEGVAGLDTELAVQGSSDDHHDMARSSSTSLPRAGSPKRGGVSGALSDVRGAAADQSHASSGSGSAAGAAGAASGDAIPKEFSHLKIKTKVDEDLPAAVDMKEFNKNFSLDDEEESKV